MDTLKTDKIRIAKAMEIFGGSKSWWYHGIMDRKIPAFKLGRTVFVSKSEIEKLIEAGRIE